MPYRVSCTHKCEWAGCVVGKDNFILEAAEVKSTVFGKAKVLRLAWKKAR